MDVKPIGEQDAVDAVTEILADRGIDWGTVTPRTVLRDIGFDSVEFAELFMILEEFAGARLNLALAGDVAVVADLVTLSPLGEAVDA